MEINIISKDVKTFDLSMFNEYVVDESEFYQEAGKQHYKLLADLSHFFQGSDIFDIGTHYGSSALALSHNPANKVMTFDIADDLTKFGLIHNTKKKYYDAPNIEFHMADLFNPNTRKFFEEKLLASPLIMIDVDPHNGLMEWDIYSYFKSVNYQGILLFDDVHYFQPMRENFWNKVDDKYKVDLTSLGHFSGTGLVIFNPNIKINIS